MPNISQIVKILRKYFREKDASVTTVSKRSRDPYQVLISCIISLRTKDEVTIPASKRLFSLAKTPRKMVKLNVRQIEKAIYPAGFYKTKARRIKTISKALVEKYEGKVPSDIHELLKLKGVGRKTANLVRGLGYNKPALCVDTHVHRTANRLGLVKTKNPDQTEFKLREVLPKEYWIEWNNLLVLYGQNICRPISPYCSKCVIRKYCERVGVVKSR